MSPGIALAISAMASPSFCIFTILIAGDIVGANVGDCVGANVGDGVGAKITKNSVSNYLHMVLYVQCKHTRTVNTSLISARAHIAT